MATQSGGARKFVTRVFAAGALLAVYCAGTLAVTGAFMTSTVTTAEARGGRGGGRGRGGGFRGGRGRGFHGGGWRGGRSWVCRHNGYTSHRRCFWVG